MPAFPKGVYVITGIMASGKSTVASLLAQRLDYSVHVRGDAFRRMIVNGMREMDPSPAPEAVEQLHLRYRIAARTVNDYFNAGFSVVAQDNYLGEDAKVFLDALRVSPLFMITLCPSVETVARREQERRKCGYLSWDVASLHRVLTERNPRVGLWLDTSGLTPEETVDFIFAHVEQARVTPGGWNRFEHPCRIEEITNPILKQEIARMTLESLPEWFGIPAAVDGYVKESAERPFFAAFIGQKPVGFAAVRANSADTAEVFVMGVSADCHRKGVGRELVHACIQWARAGGFSLLEVKTLDASHPDPYYKKTRAFYQAMGFRPLECIRGVWGEENPCLILVLPLREGHA